MKMFWVRLTGTGLASTVLLLCMSAVIALAACGGEQAAPVAATAVPATATASPSATPEPATEAPPAATQAPTDRPTPRQTPAPTAVPEPTAMSVPTVTPAPQPTGDTGTHQHAHCHAGTATDGDTGTHQHAHCHAGNQLRLHNPPARLRRSRRRLRPPLQHPAPPATRAPTPTPTATSSPTPTPTISPTATPSPTPTPSVHPELAVYSPLLAEATSNLPAQYDFVSDGLSVEEREILDWADSRLFSNESFLDSKWGPDNWPYTHSQESQGRYESAMRSRGTQNQNGSGDTVTDAAIRSLSVQALILMMREIDIQKKTNGKHVVKWEIDSLDRVLDDLGIYTGQCIHCYGNSGYDTVDGIGDNNVPIIWGHGHVHREMLKSFAYLAKADGEGILARSLLENGPDDFDLLYKRRLDRYPITIGGGSFAYENVSFMSQIRLPDGRLVSYPTMVFEMMGDAGTEREAVERVFDHVRKQLTHFTGDLDNFADIYRPYTVTPYSPELTC